MGRRRNGERAVELKAICGIGMLLAMSLVVSGFGPASFTYEGPVFPKNSGGTKPPDIMERAGGTYRLTSLSLEPAQRNGDVVYGSASIPYFLEGNQEPSQTAVVQIWDEVSGQSFEQELPRIQLDEIGEIWSEEFEFPVTITDYDADYFYLGDVQIESVENLADHGKAFLKYLGLSEEDYVIDRFIWKEKAYEKDGHLCRDGIAGGRKRLRETEVTYGGPVQLPAFEGQRYVGIYEAVRAETVEESEHEEAGGDEPEETIVSADETTEMETQPDSEPESEHDETEGNESRIVQWLRRYAAVIRLGIAFFVGIIGLVLLLKAGKKEKQKE